MDAIGNRIPGEEEEEDWMPVDGSGEGGLMFGADEIVDQDILEEHQRRQNHILLPPPLRGQHLNRNHPRPGERYRNRIAELLDRIASNRAIDSRENGFSS